MGTDLQEVFDSFIAKVPSIDFSGKESKIVQYLKSSVSKCKRRTYDNILFLYDAELQEGNFYNLISDSSIELIAMYMAKECLSENLSIITTRKQYLGTQAFNKIPAYKEQLENTQSSLQYWSDEIDKLQNELPDYSDER